MALSLTEERKRKAIENKVKIAIRILLKNDAYLLKKKR